MATKYMHLIGGEPAYFCEKAGVIFFRLRYGAAKPMADSLRQIRKEQRVSLKNRNDISDALSLKRSVGLPSDYIRVKV